VGNGGEESGGAAVGHVGSLGVGPDSLGGGVVAGTVLGSVGVVSLLLGLVGQVVAVGTVVGATVATFGAGVAINELLLGEGLEVAGFSEVGTLETAGGGEGPAGTARFLVLDGGDGTLVSPVEGAVGSNGGGALRCSQPILRRKERHLRGCCCTPQQTSRTCGCGRRWRSNRSC